MFACVCWTPFQIINAVNYKFQYAVDEDMDIYLCLKFTGAVEIGKRLLELNYIHKVYFVKNLDYDAMKPMRRKLNILADMCWPERAIKRCLGKTVTLESLDYSYVISSGYLNFNILFNNYLTAKGTKSYFFDDGLESYLPQNTADHYSGIYKIMAKVLGRGGTNLKLERLFVYAPELVLNQQRYKSVQPLMPLNKMEQTIQIDLNKVFDYKNLGLRYKYLLFDQLGTGDFRDEKMLTIQTEILNIFAEAVNINEFVIKLHPRTLSSIYDERFQTFKTSVPWEIFALNEEIENKVLISISSTACFTPKLIFDKEPIVIFLYELFSISGYETAKDFIRRVKETYRSSDKVYIPQTFEDLKHILQEIKVRDEY